VTFIEAVGPLAELLADFVERRSIALPDRQNALRRGQDMNFA
jgi:hypothetical protein